MPSAAVVDLDLLDEAPSLWAFDSERGCWWQEHTPLVADGVELPPPGQALGGAVRASGCTKVGTWGAMPCPSADGPSLEGTFWRSGGIDFDWKVGGEVGKGQDCGSGSGSGCVWAALARLCALEGYGHQTAESLLSEAQALTTTALPFTHGESQRILQDVMAGGPVSLEALRFLALPALSKVSVRALEVHDGRVVRVHRVDGPLAPNIASGCFLLEASADAAHALLLHLPPSLQGSRDFDAFIHRVVAPLPVKARHQMLWGGRKGKKLAGSANIAANVARGELKSGLGASMSKDDLQALLKDKRKLSLRLRKLGWWNCDSPLPRLAIITGRLLSIGGHPLASAQVVVKPRNYAGWAYGVSNADGTFSVTVGTGSTARVDACWKSDRSTPDLSHDGYRVKISSVFHSVDQNGDGFIDRLDLKQILQQVDQSGTFSADSAVDKLIEGMAKSQKGKVNIEEFLDFIFGSDTSRLATDFRSNVHELTPAVTWTIVMSDVHAPKTVGDCVDLGVCQL